MKKLVVKLALLTLFILFVLQLASNICLSYDCVTGTRIPKSGYCGDNSGDRVQIPEEYNWANASTLDLEFYCARYLRNPTTYKYYPNNAINFTNAFKNMVGYALTIYSPAVGGTYPITIRLHLPNCWTMNYFPDQGVDVTELDACEPADCCEIDYSVDYNPTTQTYTATRSGGAGDNKGACPTGCTAVCGNTSYFPANIRFDASTNPGLLYINGVLAIPRIGSNNEVQVLDISTLSIIPNPSQNKAQIYFTSTINGNLTYKIYNSTGDCIESINNEKTSNDISISLDFSHYLSGV